MRTISPILQAGLDNGSGAPFFTVYLSTTGTTYTAVQPLRYEIFNLKAKVTIAFTTASVSNANYFYIRRGLRINGTDYPIDSSKYRVERIESDRRSFITFDGHMFENVFVSALGHDLVANVLADCIDNQSLRASTMANYTNTITFRTPTAWWENIYFREVGSVFEGRARGLEAMIKQRYLGQLCDLGANELLIVDSSQFEDDPVMTFDNASVINERTIQTIDNMRNFIWTDETGAQHDSGSPTEPTHNLGYIESTVDPSPLWGPNSMTQPYTVVTIAMPQLKLQNGDTIELTWNNSIQQILIKEVFDPDQDPAWYQNLYPIQWIADQSTPPTDIPMTPYGRWRLKQEKTELAKAQKDKDQEQATNAADLPLHIQYIDGGGAVTEKATTLREALQMLASHSHTGLGGVAESNANDIYRVNSPGGASLWTGTISGAPSGVSVTVSAPLTGTEGVLVPASTSQLAKMVLRNLSRANSALISNYNTVTNVITLAVPVPAGWANGDTLSIASATVSGGGFNWVDFQITSGPTDKSALFLNLQINSGAAGDSMRLHPLETFGSGKLAGIDAQVAGVTQNAGSYLVKITSNKFAMTWSANSTAIVIREAGYLP